MLKSGIHNAYYETGELYEKQTWKDGMLDGDTTTYYRSGAIRAVDTFVRDRLVRTIGFDEEHKQIYEQNFRQ